ncbi:hypothetical protein V9T40_006313 [Parthenolecanium corni]|uniref:Nuclear transcription factor Y subunit gamma n=1 Tax=Parthenolecanium corni TaxID=536013 RepID=A0AAN9TMI1_9HEMI
MGHRTTPPYPRNSVISDIHNLCLSMFEPEEEEQTQTIEYPSSGGRKRMFSKELRCMMYGFGDDQNPYTESVDFLEDLVIEFITDMTHKAMDIGKSGRVQVEDILYLVRKDKRKYARVKELLNMNEELKKARKAFDEVKYAVLILFTFGNSTGEEDVDSPLPMADNENSSDPEGSSQGGDTQYGELTVSTFWPRVTEEIRKINVLDIRNQALPLARIKKIMKLDEDVKMISAEAPMLFAKAAELFIMELTLRAWVHTEDNKRRTLQRSDIAMAITKYDQFDFLIDIVPREEAKISSLNRSAHDNNTRTAVNSDQVHYYFQLAQQQANETGTNQNAGVSVGNPTTIQVIQPGTGQIQTVAIANQSQDQNTNAGNVVTAAGAGQIIQLQNANQGATSQSTNGIQLLQQIVTANGEVQHIPVRVAILK